MARRMDASAVVALAHLNFPSFLRQRSQALLIDKWCRGEQFEIDDVDSKFHGRPFQPESASAEHEDLGTRTPTPWAGLVVTSLAQTAYIDGVRMPNASGNMKVWKTAQANRWDARQSAIHREAIAAGLAYGIVLPGRDPLTRAPMAKMTARSTKRMAAFYEEDDDEYPIFAIDCRPLQATLDEPRGGWTVTLFDDDNIHYLSCKGDGFERADWTYISYEPHPVGVTPVARCVNRMDLDGRATGEIEPVIPMLRRIDQDMFDRLIVQRFGAWKVRYIAGMAKPTNQEQANLMALKLRVEDLLISGNKDTKFGTLDATEIAGFIGAGDADLRMLAAITQTPPHHLLGLSSNLQAEALAAAESGLQRKSGDFRMNAGEFHEQMFRMAAKLNGDMDEAGAVDMQVRWRDTESRSLTQAADALGKMAVQLKVPLEMLWERLPNWTDGDTERAKALAESGALDSFLNELVGGSGLADAAPVAA